MSDLATLIGNSDLFQVEVELRPIAQIISLLNDNSKKLDRRVSMLENEIKLFVRQNDYDKAYQALVDRIALTEDRMAQMSSRFAALSGDVKTLESKLNLTIDERVNDILISTNMKIQHAVGGVDAQVQMLGGQMKQMKEQLDSITANKKVDLNVLMATVKQNSSDIAKIKNRMNDDRQMINEKIQKSRSTSLDKLDAIDTSVLNMKIEDNESLLKQVNQQKAVLLDVVEELNKIKEKLEMEKMKVPEIQETQKIVEDRKLNVGNGNLNTVALETELSKLENDFESHQDKVVAAMNAIQFELQQIRDHGEGLAGLPPLNLANVVPSFFNNPSFTWSRNDDSAEEDFESNQSSLNSIRSGKHHTRPSIAMISRNLKRSSDALDAISSNASSECQTPITQNRSKVGFGIPKRESEPIVVTEKVDVDEIISKIKNELDIQGMKDTFKQIKNEHTQAMSTIERKIEREYVERLFDKFRVIIHGLNDRIKELASLNNDCATRQDMQLVVQFLKNMPKESRPGTAVKKGPSCLFCNRPKTSIAGEISPRTAAMAGSPPVRSVANEGSSCEFIYGDGQAYRRDENFQSFPHFDFLPPLPGKTTSNSVSPKKA
ncbi:hypothetical protein TRFO_18229 [Tritrichomonas foetus]|uniref:Uncharacterized protein n=1 Tax=Tritrichomonas foetus TaxID=1144522 RepID=A0A1J4KM78_9EUKA|nr:hypothetical protein TRFO_18229 [Tritrichomonas foetus]|eukprot:OHT12040.1 hypothetical protein TRFO_18229 [Tritrichomonas foetus]